MWRHRSGGLKKKLYLRSVSQRHRHFVGLFNVPVLYGYSEKRPHLVALYNTLGIRRTFSRLEPPASSHGCNEVKTTLISLLPVKPGGTTGFLAVCQSVCLSVRQSVQSVSVHSVFSVALWDIDLKFGTCIWICLDIIQIKFDLLLHELLPFAKISFSGLFFVIFRHIELNFIYEFVLT